MWFIHWDVVTYPNCRVINFCGGVWSSNINWSCLSDVLFLAIHSVKIAHKDKNVYVPYFIVVSYRLSVFLRSSEFHVSIWKKYIGAYTYSVFIYKVYDYIGQSNQILHGLNHTRLMFNEEFILRYNIKLPMSNTQPSGPPPPHFFGLHF